MRTFLLRTMQAMMLFSICLLAWLAVSFFSHFLVRPIMLSQQETFVCGTKSADSYSYPTPNGLDGKALFNANCAMCHRRDKALTGPALMAIEERWPDKKLLYSWIRNSEAVLKTGNNYTNALFKTYFQTRMPAFPNLSDNEIAAILAYIN